jgi:hypothetical protein
MASRSSEISLRSLATSEACAGSQRGRAGLSRGVPPAQQSEGTSQARRWRASRRAARTFGMSLPDWNIIMSCVSVLTSCATRSAVLLGAAAAAAAVVVAAVERLAAEGKP